MTIAISLKVNDGVVLAADSATSLMGKAPDGRMGVINVYNNANKVFNLRKGLPIGALTWGSGSVGIASISTLVKDLRQRFAGHDNNYPSWVINPNDYNILSVATKLKEFIFDELYVKSFQDWPQKPFLGFAVSGYSSGQVMAEEYQIEIKNGECIGPFPMRPKGDCGVTWSGEPEAISRLILGFSSNLPNILENNFKVPKDQIGNAMPIIQQQLTVPFVMPAMPIQDAIDLAEFLVDLTIKYSRFSPGAPTVGGPIEIAAITKHEGFKWVQRKHYFNSTLNPEV